MALCPICKGKKVIWWDDGDYGSKWIPCPRCQIKGRG